MKHLRLLMMFMVLSGCVDRSNHANFGAPIAASDSDAPGTTRVVTIHCDRGYPGQANAYTTKVNITGLGGGVGIGGEQDVTPTKLQTVSACLIERDDTFYRRCLAIADPPLSPYQRYQRTQKFYADLSSLPTANTCK